MLREQTTRDDVVPWFMLIYARMIGPMFLISNWEVGFLLEVGIKCWTYLDKAKLLLKSQTYTNKFARYVFITDYTNLHFFAVRNAAKIKAKTVAWCWKLSLVHFCLASARELANFFRQLDARFKATIWTWVAPGCSYANKKFRSYSLCIDNVKPNDPVKKH